MAIFFHFFEKGNSSLSLRKGKDRTCLIVRWYFISGRVPGWKVILSEPGETALIVNTDTVLDKITIYYGFVNFNDFCLSKTYLLILLNYLMNSTLPKIPILNFKFQN